MNIEQASEILEEVRWESQSGLTGLDGPRNYIGSRFEVYRLYTYTDLAGDALAESNFYSFLEALGGEEAEGVSVVRMGHWTYRYYDLICLELDAPDETKIKAAEILCALSEYPVLDEHDWSEREYRAVLELWGDTIEQRLRVIRDYNEFRADSPVSIFAARDSAPQDDRLYDYLVG